MINILTMLANTGAEESQGIAALGIDPIAILAQGVTFLLLFLLIKKFAFSKIVDTLEQRRKTIENSLDKAEALTKQNEEAEEKVKAALHEARKESEEIIAKSHEEAGALIAEAEDKAAIKTQKIIDDGKVQIDQQVVRAQETLKKETLDLVSRATTALLGEVIDVKKHEDLIKKALNVTKETK